MNRRIAIAENTLRDVQSEFVETEQRIAAKKSAKEQEEAMDIDATNKQQESIKAPMEATVSVILGMRRRGMAFFYSHERRIVSIERRGVKAE